MKVAVRADASTTTGLGHVMRCLALAGALRGQGAQVHFVARSLVGPAAGLITGQGHGLVLLEDGGAAPDWEADAAQTGRVLAGLGGVDWVVVDHYGLDARWERAVRGAGAQRILAIDDLADRPHDAQLLLDQNLHADAQRRYAAHVTPGCGLLLGPRHALLRPEFAALHRGAGVRQGAVRRLLVLLGGTDAANRTGCVLDALDLLALPPRQLHVDVVIGGAHPARAQLAQRCAARAATTLHVDSTEVAALMAQADLAVGAGGVTTWERCALGLPALALCIADNQREVLAQAARHGLLVAPELDGQVAADVALHLGALIANAPLREMLSRQALAAVDGLGARRVADAMRLRQLSLQWRTARMEDAQALLDWRNHPSIRAVSHQGGVIGLEGHRAWLAAVIADPNRHLLIASLDGQPAGVVRYDVHGERAEVSIYRVPGGPGGTGLGAQLLDSAQQWLRTHCPQVTSIVAEVRADNAASRRMFETAGYGVEMLRYSKTVS